MFVQGEREVIMLLCRGHTVEAEEESGGIGGCEKFESVHQIQMQLAAQ